MAAAPAAAEDAGGACRLAPPASEIEAGLALSRSDNDIEELQDCLAAANEAWTLLQPEGTNTDGAGDQAWAAAASEPAAAAALSEALAAAQRRVALLKGNLDVLHGRSGAAGDEGTPDSAEGDNGAADNASALSSDLAWDQPSSRSPPTPEASAVALGIEVVEAADIVASAGGAAAVAASSGDAVTPAVRQADESAPVSDEEDEGVLQEGAIRTSDLEVVDWLGKGAVGKVYLVRQVSTGELFAVKALSKRAMLQKKKGVAHVMQELNILRSCARKYTYRARSTTTACLPGVFPRGWLWLQTRS